MYTAFSNYRPGQTENSSHGLLQVVPKCSAEYDGKVRKQLHTAVQYTDIWMDNSEPQTVISRTQGSLSINYRIHHEVTCYYS
jgi:hypothetical protein